MQSLSASRLVIIPHLREVIGMAPARRNTSSWKEEAEKETGPTDRFCRFRVNCLGNGTLKPNGDCEVGNDDCSYTQNFALSCVDLCPITIILYRLNQERSSIKTSNCTVFHENDNQAIFKNPEMPHLNRGALHACDPERHSPVVNLVVRVVLEERVGDLREAKPLVALHYQRHDADAVKVYGADLDSVDRMMGLFSLSPSDTFL